MKISLPHDYNYSGTSDKGHSERGQTSQQRTHNLYSSIHTLYEITSERGQPLYKGQTSGSQWCPLFGGSTVYALAHTRTTGYIATHNVHTDTNLSLLIRLNVNPGVWVTLPSETINKHVLINEHPTSHFFALYNNSILHGASLCLLTHETSVYFHPDLMIAEPAKPAPSMVITKTGRT